MANRPPPFTEQEAAVLLNTYLELEYGSLSRAAAVRCCSDRLRRMAIERGLDIDETYRNANGISFQISSMESAWRGETIKLPATRLFARIVAMYRNDRSRYEALLKEALEMEEQSGEERFMTWLSGQVSPEQLSLLHMALWEVEQYALQNHLVTGSLYAKLDVPLVKKLRSGFELDRQFSRGHRFQMRQISSALHFLSRYAQETVGPPKTPPAIVETRSPPVRVPDVSVEHAPSPTSTVLQPVETHLPPADVSAAVKSMPPSKEELSVSEEGSHTPWQTVDFQNVQDLTYTKPSSVTYFGCRRETASWRDACIMACQFLLDDYPQVFERLCTDGLNRRGQMWLLNDRHKDAFHTPAPIGSGYYIEANRNALNLMQTLRRLLDACAVDYENLIITYAAIPNATKRTRPSATQQSAMPSTAQEKKDESAFFQWMLHDQHMAETSCRSYLSAIRAVERWAAARGIRNLYIVHETEATDQALLRDPDFQQCEASQRNRCHAALRKLLEFLTSRSDSEPTVPSEDLAPYEDVLRKYFPRGYRLQSKVERSRFLSYYEELTGQLCPLPSEDVDRIVMLCGIVCSNRVYLPEHMLSPELHDRILDTIHRCFDEGKNTVYYEALYQKFYDELLDSKLHDPDMLRLYLIHTVGDQYHMDRDYLSRNAYIQSDPTSEVRACLQASALPMSVDDLCRMLPHLPKEHILKALRANEFVSNGRDVYFHIDVLGLSEDELDDIADLIRTLIAQQEYIGCNELLQVIKAKYPSLYDRGAAISVTGWRNVLRYYLGDRFSFKGNIISSPDTRRTSQNVFAEFAKTQRSFSHATLLQFGKSIGVRQVNFDDLFRYVVRVSKEQYVSRSDVEFRVPETDAALDGLCTGNYLPLQQVSDFTLSMLPDASHPWTTYLLEQYVAFYSQRYQLLHNSFLQASVTGAMVRRGCGLDSFDTLLTDALASSGVTLEQDPALTYLAANGYLAQKSYQAIGMRLVEARALRNQRKGK